MTTQPTTTVAGPGNRTHRMGREQAQATTIDPELIHAHGRREYHQAHEVTGLWVQEHLAELALLGPMIFDVIMIKHKLDRLLADPGRRDHLDDLIGYARLALELQQEYFNGK